MSQLFTIDPSITSGGKAFSIDWSDWLASGTTISSSSWTISPSGPNVSNQSEDSGVTTARVDSATEGQTYLLTNTITTSDGDKEERSLTLICEEV